jgi:hypothetical protein
MEILHKAKNLEISYDPEHRFMYCNWIGFQNHEMIVESGAIILSMFQKMGISKVLNDNRLVSGPWQGAGQWTANVWFPDMIEAGLKYFAWVFPPDTYAQFSVEKAMPASSVVKSFDSYEVAYRWLVSQP